MRGHYKSQCDCGKNEDGRYWIYFIGDERPAGVLFIFPGCGRPSRVETAWASARAAAAAVEGEEPGPA